MKLKQLLILFILTFFLIHTVAALSIPAPPSEFEVYTAEDLKAVDYQPSNIVSIVLMNDITITDEVWKPIGSSKPFTGEFKGNNHTITFTKDTEFIQAFGSENTGCGLFGYVYNGQIRDLNVVFLGNLKSSENNTGALVGILNGNNSSIAPSPSIVNCNVVSSNGYSVSLQSVSQFSLSGANNVGGLVGHVINGSIENSSSECSVTASGNNAGGLVGFISHGTILNSSASGSVKAAENAGGLIGYISNETTISNSSADGSVKPAGAFGDFIGNWDDNYKPTIMNCFYRGTEVDLAPVSEVEIYYKNYTFFIFLAAGILLLIAVAVIFYLKKRNN